MEIETFYIIIILVFFSVSLGLAIYLFWNRGRVRNEGESLRYRGGSTRVVTFKNDHITKRFKCPDCDREVSQEEVRCPFCGVDFLDDAFRCQSCDNYVSPSQIQCFHCGDILEADPFLCPNCSEIVSPRAKHCPYCSENFWSPIKKKLG